MVARSRVRCALCKWPITVGAPRVKALFGKDSYRLGLVMGSFHLRCWHAVEAALPGLREQMEALRERVV